MMGLTNQPYHVCQALTWAKCIAMGYLLGSDIPFTWKKVVLNLPGTEEYDCQSPQVFKQSVDGFLSADLFIYMDNGRLIEPINNLCWEASRRWGSMCLFGLLSHYFKVHKVEI